MTSTLTSDVQQRLTGTALGGGAQAGPLGTIPLPLLQGGGLLAGLSGGARGERACVCPLRQTRQHIQRWLKPGMKMIDICEHLEGVARQLVEENGLKSGGGGAGGGAQVRWGWGLEQEGVVLGFKLGGLLLFASPLILPSLTFTVLH